MNVYCATFAKGDPRKQYILANSFGHAVKLVEKSTKDYQEMVMKASGRIPHLEIESVEYICTITISDTGTIVEKGD